ncbi:MAG: hypothetical protein RMJ45_07000 [Candidatus Calescibacterium sp.]|nr:hypothetical protein [Candidatus Calescibacterium sp.]
MKIRNIFFYFALFFVFILVLEVLFRAFFFFGHRSGFISFFISSYILTEMGGGEVITSDQKLLYKYLPNRSFVLKTDSYEHEIKTVDLGFGDIGFRDNGISSEVFAVAVGDSISACIGVEYHHCWVKILEDKIKSDVVNMGVGGYSTTQKSIVAQNYALKLKPKFLLFEINFSDPCDDFYFVNRKKLPIPHPLNNFVSSGLQRYLITFTFAKLLFETYYYGYTPQRRYRMYYSSCDSGVDFTVQSIEKVYSESVKQGTDFVLLVFQERFFPQKLRAYLTDKKNNMYILDFSDLEENADGIYHADGHFNVKGNTLVAEIIYNYLVSDRILK